jgi:hypothetical protein
MSHGANDSEVFDALGIMVAQYMHFGVLAPEHDVNTGRTHADRVMHNMARPFEGGKSPTEGKRVHITHTVIDPVPAQAAWPSPHIIYISNHILAITETLGFKPLWLFAPLFRIDHDKLAARTSWRRKDNQCHVIG